jgi:hypothetical protein
MLPVLITSVLGALLKNNLPGVAQAVLDKGLGYVEEKLGVELKPEMTPEEIARIQTEALKHEEFKIEQSNKNTSDARAMHVAALAQDDVFAKRFSLYLATFWSLAAVLYIGFVTFGEIPLANVRFADTILGFLLGTIIATIMNFFFGSSIGSKDKDEINKKLFSK